MLLAVALNGGAVASFLGGSAPASAARARPALRTSVPVAGLFDAFNRNKAADQGATRDTAALVEEDSEQKRLKAEKLRLQAEIAELQAKELSLKARAIAPPPPPQPTVAPPSPAPAPVMKSEEVGESLAELCAAIEGAAASNGLESAEPLQRSVQAAWRTGRNMQQDEIATLKRRLDAAVQLEKAAPEEGERSFGETMAATSLRLEETERMRKQYVGVSELWQMADNITLSSTTERRARARAVTRASFKFLSTLTTYDEEEEQRGDDGKVAVPGEGLVSVTASRQRLRLLERHESAGCVEYRMFAAALANDDAFESASGTELLLSEEQVTGNVTALLAQWFEMTFGQDNEEWNEALGNDLAEMQEELGSKEKPLAPWLAPLAELLGRSTDVSLSPGDILELEQITERATLFPLLLLALVGRQGNLEPLVVYYLARLLARFNARSLAKFEGRDLAANPDLAVAQAEASYVRQPQNEFLEGLAGGIVLTYVVSLALGAALLWNVVNGIFGAFAPPPIDPLAF